MCLFSKRYQLFSVFSDKKNHCCGNCTFNHDFNYDETESHLCICVLLTFGLERFKNY